MTTKNSYRPTFYLTINALFILFIVLVGGVLAWHSYRDTRQIVLLEANEEYDHILASFTIDFQHTYRSVFKAVELLAMTDIVRATNLEERLQSLPLLSTAAQSLPEVSGLQVGYANGDYLIVRYVSAEWMRERFAAPDNAAFIFDHIAFDQTGQAMMQRIFYGQHRSELLRLPPEPTEYDTRTRPWYRQAFETGLLQAVPPYLFYFTKEVGTTVSYHPPDSTAVIAADVTLRQLSETLKNYLLTPGSEIALIDPTGRVLAYSRTDRPVVSGEGDEVKIRHLSELGSPVLQHIAEKNLVRPGSLSLDVEGRGWHGAGHIFRVNEAGGRDLMLLMVTPYDELLADANRMTKTSLLITLGILLLSIPFASLLATRISGALTRLAGEAADVSRFDFEKPVSVRSHIKEINELALAMDLMKSTISRFLAMINSLSREQNFDAMLALITVETMNISEADAALTWLVDDTTNRLQPAAFFTRSDGQRPLDGLPSYNLDETKVLPEAARQRHVRQLRLERAADGGLSPLFDSLEAQSARVAAFPLRNRKDEELGLLCLLYKDSEPSGPVDGGVERLDFVKTFSGFASVSLESRHLLELQKRLMDSFMHLMAGAIDAKSPYTGGHCQRVPVLAKMLAEAACEDQGVFRDFELDEDGWEALHLAGWLHDCGKVTTPEYVVDKATKLETLYDRIHEIRTRFEVLKRDTEIRYWEGVASGGDRVRLREQMCAEQAALDADFAFVAECNNGDTPMSEDKIARLEKIAGRTWLRTLDDRIGISWEEERRKSRTPAATLPVEETLLADREDHLVERREAECMSEDNPWGFKLKVPKYLYNYGELYNLRTERGTLTMEERYKINDHVVQTIIMLGKLPYPKHLQEVPAIAGGHHEKMDGTGYPKKLAAEQMSLPARMMAIADIFEALTASDRPYKKAKMLSDSVRIMSFFRNDRHIDGDLFELFLRSGVYLEYARQYLRPEQIDEVDIDQYLTKG